MHRTNRRDFIRLLGLGSGAALLAACGQSSPGAAPTSAPAAKAGAESAPAAGGSPNIDQLYEAAKKEGKVVWWDQHTQDVAQKYIDTFKAKYPGIEVEYFLQTQDELRQKVVAEARAGRYSVDVIDSGLNYNVYKENGVVSDNTDLILAAGVDKSLMYEGTYSPEYTVSGVAVNTDLVKDDVPTTWDALLDPKWKGKLAVESRMRPFIYATGFWGEERVTKYLTTLKELQPRFTKGDADSNTLLVAGEFPVLVGAYLHNFTKYETKGRPWTMAPIDEIWVQPKGPGYTIPEKAPHPNAARIFLYWFVGPEGSTLMDQLRSKGDPRPGAGTDPSKYLEAKKITPKIPGIEYELEYSKWEKKYAAVAGLPIT